MKKNEFCMNCNGSRLKQFIDLGAQPNGNNFPDLHGINDEKRFPFAMAVCTDCWQVQLEEFPPMDYMFENHPYVTGLNQPVVQHFDKLADKTLKRYRIPSDGLVLDIGANDGTLLSKFRDRGLRVLGIDPCQRSSELSRKAGLTVFEAFWNQQTAEAIKQLGICPDLITATAVFYHIEDLHSFVQGLDSLRGENTVFCTQCVYLKDVIEHGQFDHFYHEHTMIHAIAPLKTLFSKYGLRLLDVDFYPIHGGSFVLYVGREESPFPTTQSINSTILMEKHFGLDCIQTYIDFSKRVKRRKTMLVNLLKGIKDKGERVFGLGAPLKGSTLLNYCNIGPDLVEYTVEINPYKVGRYTPGTHIPIVHEDSIREQPDYYLLLTWNFLDFFIEKYSAYLEAGGKFIVPHPTVTVIDKEWVIQRYQTPAKATPVLAIAKT